MPGAGVRVDGQAGRDRAQALGARCRGLRPGRLLPVPVDVAADLADRPEQGQGQLRRVGEQLVLGHLVQQHGRPAGVDEPAGRERWQGHLAVPALGRGAPLDHGELALGERAGRRGGQGHVQAQAVVAAGVVELDPEPRERLAGPQLDVGDGADEGPVGRAGRAGRVEAERPAVGPLDGQARR